MTIWTFVDRIHPIPVAARITLGEGHTPLVRSRRLGDSIGLPNLWFKLETTNPTGSYKDRFAVVAIAQMVERQKTVCLATSSGNTGAALAAYCAAAGIHCEIAVLETTPIGKLSQMLAYGATIRKIEQFGTDAGVTQAVFELLAERAAELDDSPKISAFCHCPVGMSGVQTISFELNAQADEQGICWSHVFTPAGGGGMTLAVARGFDQLVASGHLAQGPRVECVQPEGNATIAGPLLAGRDRAEPVECSTQISGLQVPTVLDGDQVIEACRRSGGSGHLVTDDRVWEAQRRLARQEGIFSEPAGAVALAGAWLAAEQGKIAFDEHVVCLVTGSGFKDPQSIDRLNSDLSVPTITCDAFRQVITNLH